MQQFIWIRDLWIKSEKTAKNLEKLANEKNYNITIYKADITNEVEIKQMVDYTIKTYHKINVLVNNAGAVRTRI